MIKVTILSYQSNVSTIYLEEPKIGLINPLKIWTVLPGKKGTEIRDEFGKNTIVVKESVEEIYEQIHKE